MLQPFVRNTQLCECPSDLTWRCGYCMSYINGLPTGLWTPGIGVLGMPDSGVTDPSGRLVVWDHRRTPGCADTTNFTANPRPPFTSFEGLTSCETHYPNRHNAGCNLLFYDGHVKWMKRGSLRSTRFREPNYLPGSYTGQ